MKSSCRTDPPGRGSEVLMNSVQVADGLSIARGMPLSEEQGVGPLTLGAYLREVSTRFGPREAACMRARNGQGMIRWTYDELWRQSMDVARALVAGDVGKGTRVGVMTTNRLEFLAGLFGTALAGGVATTLSTFSTPAELEILLQQSGIAVLIFERNVLRKDFAEILVQLEPRIATAAPGELRSQKFPFLRHLAMVDSEEGVGAIEGWSTFRARGQDVAPALAEARAAQVAPSDPGALFFSSGSTGKPKGILSAHRALCLQLWRWERWHNIPETVRALSANGLFWSGSFAMFVGGTLSGGGTLVLQATFKAEEALALVQQERVSLLNAWAHQWAQLEGAPNWATADLSGLRYVSCPTPVTYHPTMKTDWRAPRGYGNSEAFTLIVAYPSGTPDEIIKGSFGIPTPGSTVKIVDPLTGETAPVGERGEIAVKGPTLMLGYVGIPLDETLDGEGFLRTGDGGYMDGQGRLYWEGRLNDIIKTGGANVSPVEVDIVVARCPGVKATQTVGVPDELLGEIVVACIVPHAGAALTEQIVRNFARELLASYKVPRRVLFFSEEALNLTGSAKIKAAEMRKLATERLARGHG
jgi:fatty-acyl-CoA synthase